MIRAIAIAGVLAGLSFTASPVLADNDPPGVVARCQSALDAMSGQTVRKETVRALGKGTRVNVIPFCMGVGTLSFGNASGLGKTIGANPVLAAALARSGFRADDVTNITVQGSSVRLYVHRD